MAQPVFDGHPLEEYFEDSGEASELMPGGMTDILLQPYLTDPTSISKHADRMEKLGFLIFGAVESLSSFFSSHRMSLRTQAFAERFKYGVISSSLLSPAFSTTPMAESHRRTLSPSLPGKLSNGHSRTPSAAESMMTDNLSLSMPPEPEAPLWPFTLSFTVAVVAFSARFYFCALLLLAATLYYMHVHRLDGPSKVDVMTPSLLALQHLTAAGHVWDTMINDTFTLLENAEQSIFHSPTSPLTPSSSLRVALSTSLLTTQTQCDNVRQLLSAITSPSELAQLAEMYAPPSPIKPTFARSNNSHRPLSHPGSPPHATPATDRMKKRSTWNGSYTSLALAGTSSALATRRRKRRSDLSAVLGSTSPTPARIRSRNALSSPPQLLADVSEEEGMVTAESSLDEEEHSFGAAALGLYRSRVCEGLRALELSHRRTPSSLSCGSSTRHRTTMSPGSKYTSMHTRRHPFSLSSLRQSLQNALASKRFACSHLLALRFEDDEDEVYWEDVRSVMSLLTSTLVDASSRLSEVLDEVEEQRLKMDDTPSESASGLQTPSSLASPPPARTRLPLSQAIEQVVSFAPTPSHLARFASHVDAISSALDDAREQLRQCVALLKEDQTLSSPGHSSHPSSSSCGDVPPNGASTAINVSAGTFGEPSEHPAIQAYERLRRELGLALRECERGRERLVHIVAPPTPSTEEDLFADDPDDVKDASQPPLPSSSFRDDDVRLTVLSPSGEPVQLESERDPESEPGVGVNSDDATAHLLFAASAAHLPPPGIEQVFETDSGGVGTFMRERSKLSREERIRLAKAKRERGERVSRPGHDPIHDADAAPHAPAADDDDDADASSPRRERWGPSGDVVQELKDVIWKVGERRRKMTDSQMLLGTVISGLENPSVSRVDVDMS